MFIQGWKHVQSNGRRHFKSKCHRRRMKETGGSETIRKCHRPPRLCSSLIWHWVFFHLMYKSLFPLRNLCPHSPIRLSTFAFSPTYALFSMYFLTAWGVHMVGVSTSILSSRPTPIRRVANLAAGRHNPELSDIKTLVSRYPWWLHFLDRRVGEFCFLCLCL